MRHEPIESSAPLPEVRLKHSLESSSDVVIHVSSRPWSTPRIALLDMDGVLTITEEGEIFEKSWALLWLRLTKPDRVASLKNLTPEQIEAGRAFRRETKGGALKDRIEIMISKARAAAPQTAILSGPECLRLFEGSNILQIESACARDPLGGVMPGAREMLQRLKELGIERHVVTAALRPRAEWLIDKTGLSNLLDSLRAYSFDLPQVDKTALITEVLNEAGIAPSDAVYVGDSPHDIEFARLSGVRSIGVALNYPNGLKLIAKNCDLVVRNTRTLAANIDRLFSPDLRQAAF